MDLINTIKKNDIPKHIAIIMDGNRRWATGKNLPRNLGHKAGMQRVRDVLEVGRSLNISDITVYAFSTENWGRKKEEVNFLMNLLIEYLKKELRELNENGIKINLLGNKEDLPELVQRQVEYAMNITKNNDKLNFNIALNYGGRNEIISAVKTIANRFKNNDLDIDTINSETFKEFLFTKDISDPDLLIRTSGEIRLSNFLLYQLAYTEFYFTNVLWPDFTKEEFLKAILNYQNRNRRYGRL